MFFNFARLTPDHRGTKIKIDLTGKNRVNIGIVHEDK